MSRRSRARESLPLREECPWPSPQLEFDRYFDHHVDRLAVTETAVLIADYKTNRPPPARIADAPPAYVRQLALYRAVLRKIYPSKTIRAALIWTETPELMEVSQEALDHALLQFTSA